MGTFFNLSLLFFIFLTGCNSSSAPTPHSTTSKRPSWITNPMQNGKVGAVGVAGRTYDQKVSTQRKLAITRALDELTLQKGVQVNLNMQKSDVVVNEQSQTSIDTQSTYSASSKVTAHVESMYEDNYTNELYIWMVLD